MGSVSIGGFTIGGVKVSGGTLTFGGSGKNTSQTNPKIDTTVKTSTGSAVGLQDFVKSANAGAVQATAPGGLTGSLDATLGGTSIHIGPGENTQGNPSGSNTNDSGGSKIFAGLGSGSGFIVVLVILLLITMPKLK